MNRKPSKCYKCGNDVDAKGLDFGSIASCPTCNARRYLEKIQPFNLSLICPYCITKIDRLDSEYGIRPGLGETGRGMGFKCDHCGKWFRLDVIMEPAYSTRRIVSEGDVNQARKNQRHEILGSLCEGSSHGYND